MPGPLPFVLRPIFSLFLYLLGFLHRARTFSSLYRVTSLHLEVKISTTPSCVMYFKSRRSPTYSTPSHIFLSLSPPLSLPMLSSSVYFVYACTPYLDGSLLSIGKQINKDVY